MDLFPIDGPAPGRLWLCSRPRSGPWLDSDVAALREAGVDVLVSALTVEEIAKLGLEPVPGACAVAGIEFAHFPVGNLQVPSLDAALVTLGEWRGALSRGQGLAIHCWATVGRSPTLAAALLVAAGFEPGLAWERVEAARGRQVPDTNEQRQWVFDVHARLGSGR